MATKTKKATSRVKARKPVKTTARRVTAAKAGVKKIKTPPKKVVKKKVEKKPAPKAVLRKLKKYSPRSRYASYRIGDRVQFSQIKNWESGLPLEKITGIVIDKIDDKVLKLRFIEVEFDLHEQLPYTEVAIMTRRFIVK